MDSKDKYPEVLTLKDIQEILRIGRNAAYTTIYQAEATGMFRVFKIQNSWRIPRDSFFDWLYQSPEDC